MLNDVEEECQFHFRNSEYIIVTLSADSLLIQRPRTKRGNAFYPNVEINSGKNICGAIE